MIPEGVVIALPFIKREEGFVDHIYLDGAGVKTCGYGTTEADVSPLPQHITEPQASALLVGKLLSKYWPAVERLKLPNPNMQAACLSIAYNCGPGILGSGYTLGRALLARDYPAAANAFLLYVHDVLGNVEPGLVTRRRFEKRRFETPWVDPDPHHYGRLDRTPRHLLGRRFSEFEVVVEYDKKRRHQRLYPRRLARLREDCGVLAARLEERRHAQGGWHGEQEWRHGQLVGREDDRRYV